MRNRRLITLSAFFGCLCAGLPALAQDWTQITPGSAPSSRQDHGMSRFGDNILLFGGSLDKTSGTPNLNDTWEWDGTTWTELFPATVPLGRTGHAMAYDPVRHKVVMFSGRDVLTGVGYSDETWEWDGTDWTLMTTPVHPPVRDWSDMEWDPNTGTILLFAGRDSDHKPSGSFEPYNDTWSWDGTAWTEHFPTNKPAIRLSHRMAYDPNLDVVLVTGGTAPGITGLNDTWAWDGTNWTELSPTTAYTKRAFGSMEFDDARGVMVIHSGKDLVANNLHDDTWEFDGTTWTQVSTSGPQYGWFHMIYDPINLNMLVQGGSADHTHSSSDGDTWVYGRTPWTDMGFDLPGSLGSPVLKGVGELSAGSLLTFELTNALPSTFAYFVLGLTDQSVPFKGGTLVPTTDYFFLLPTDTEGSIMFSPTYGGAAAPGTPLYLQYWVIDASGPWGATASNAITATTL